MSISNEHIFAKPDEIFLDEEHEASVDYGWELINRMEKLGFQVPAVTLLDFESLQSHGDEGEKWIAKFLALQKDVRIFLSKTRIDTGCWGKF